jgi:hypothetical protein
MELGRELGRHEAAALADEQRRAHRRLELRELVAQRRLRAVELRRGGGDIAELVDRDERGQERQVGERHRAILSIRNER